MKTILKIRNAARILVVSSALLASIGTGSALAHNSIDGTNSTTGPNSENINRWRINRDLDLDIENYVRVWNGQDFYVNSGRNEIEHNTVVDDITTGDITGNISVVNKLNSAPFMLSHMNNWSNLVFDFVNHLTGPNSINKNEAKIDANMDIDIDNHAHVDNKLRACLNTGENDVKNNTQVGDVETGDIEFTVSNSTTANQNASSLDWHTMDAMEVSGDFENSVTGPNSENINQLEVKANQDVDIENKADIDNEVDIKANTGQNEIGQNTVVGDVKTGDIKINSTTTNIAN